MILGEGINGIPELTVEEPVDLEALEEVVVADYPDNTFIVGHLVMSRILEDDENRASVLPFKLSGMDAVRALCSLGRHPDVLAEIEIVYDTAA
jgi:hypothetical protein